MTTLRSISLNAVAVAVLGSAALLGSASAIAQTSPSPAVRIVSRIDEGQLVALKGNVNPHATAANDRGPVDPTLPMADMVLVLSRSPEVQAAFDAYVAGQYDRTSPQYHQWLTPAQIGARFGAAESDINAMSAWLSSRGFTVTSVANDHMAIHFTGTAAQAESAFHVEIHKLAVGNESHIANMTDPQIPAAMAPVVQGVKGLQNFLPHPNHKVGSAVRLNEQAGKWQRVTTPAAVTATAGSEASATKIRPQFGINECADPTANPCPVDETSLEEDIGPLDFATIYNVLPLWQASTPINGANQTIAILGTSDLCLGQSGSPCNSNNDVLAYRNAFGLPAGPSAIQVAGVNGIDPGVCVNSNNACNNGDLLENSLDVEMAAAVAPGAQIVLVTSGYNSQTSPSNDPLYADAEYVIDNHGSQSLPVGSASILSLSYGVCELLNGTTSNVAYYNLWQVAAAEGISVFVSTGDSGSPTCDDGEDGVYGNPYSARYGINVNALASTPWDTAVGGTDFSWCKPTVDNSSGSNHGQILGCPTLTSSPGPYWNTTNGGSSQGYESAKGYVPEIPWNDTCLNPILGTYLESVATYFGVSGVSTAEESCNFSANQNEYTTIYNQTGGLMLAAFVDTIGGSGGASGCVLNNSDQGFSSPTCNSGATSINSLPLYNNGWPKPSWQANISPADGVRDIPDVSFFAGNGELDSATLVCSSVIIGSSCSVSSTNANMLEVGGTSVATPQMAGVMALINQKIGTPQGLANPELYRLATLGPSSGCSASGTPSSNCYFNDVDSGTIAMPCDLGAIEGGVTYDYSSGEYLSTQTYAGINSPNCMALSSNLDTIGTLVSSGTTAAYNAGAGYDLATGLGSLNIANVVNNWTDDTGTGSATLTLAASPTSITINQSDTVTVTVSGSSGTPTGTVVLVGGGYTSSVVTLSSGGVATISIPANSLPAGAETLNAFYSGDSNNYAPASNSLTLTVNKMTPTVTVSAPSTDNVANQIPVAVTITGPTGATAVPSGTISLSGGGYSSSNLTLSGGYATVLIPAGSLAVANDTLTATYNGDSNYAGGANTATTTIVSKTLSTPTVTVSPASSSINSSQTLAVTVAVTGSAGTATNSVSLAAGSYTSPITTLTGGSATITIPSNTLSTGSVTLTATYSGDSNYSLKTGTATVNVNQSTVTLATPTNPAAIAPGSSATVTINGSTSTTSYNGTVKLSTCTQTSGTTNTGGAISCTVSGTITYTNGAPTCTTTPCAATVTTTAAHTSELVYPKLGNGKEWLGTGAGAILAFVVFLGIPARRRSWRGMLGMIVLLVGLGSLVACGGGGSVNSGGGSTTTAGTTAGTYTFTVTGTASPSATSAPTASFTVTVN